MCTSEGNLNVAFEKLVRETSIQLRAITIRLWLSENSRVLFRQRYLNCSMHRLLYIVQSIDIKNLTIFPFSKKFETNYIISLRYRILGISNFPFSFFCEPFTRISTSLPISLWRSPQESINIRFRDRQDSLLGYPRHLPANRARTS